MASSILKGLVTSAVITSTIKMALTVYETESEINLNIKDLIYRDKFRGKLANSRNCFRGHVSEITKIKELVEQKLRRELTHSDCHILREKT